MTPYNFEGKNIRKEKGIRIREIEREFWRGGERACVNILFGAFGDDETFVTVRSVHSFSCFFLSLSVRSGGRMNASAESTVFVLGTSMERRR